MSTTNGEHILHTAQQFLANRENEQRAANWLAQTRERFLEIDTAGYSLDQLRIVKRLADELVGRMYAEIWAKENGKVAPAYGSPDWPAFYDEWLASE